MVSETGAGFRVLSDRKWATCVAAQAKPMTPHGFVPQAQPRHVSAGLVPHSGQRRGGPPLGLIPEAALRVRDYSHI